MGGAEVERRSRNNWYLDPYPKFDEDTDYRIINPQPKYRPFQLGDDFRKVFEKDVMIESGPYSKYTIENVEIRQDKVTFYFYSWGFAGRLIVKLTAQEALNDVKFTNGEPFGVKEEKTTIPPMAY